MRRYRERIKNGQAIYDVTVNSDFLNALVKFGNVSERGLLKRRKVSEVLSAMLPRAPFG